MIDRLSREARSGNMRAVKQRDTAPEMVVRRLLHGAGYRYRLHRRDLPGTPDIVFIGRRKAVFIHGCFWHGHDCRAGKPPATKTDYWLPKIARNRTRDAAAVRALETMGWAVLVVWACELSDRQALAHRLRSFVD